MADRTLQTDRGRGRCRGGRLVVESHTQDAIVPGKGADDVLDITPNLMPLRNIHDDVAPWAAAAWLLCSCSKALSAGQGRDDRRRNHQSSMGVSMTPIPSAAAAARKLSMRAIRRSLSACQTMKGKVGAQGCCSPPLAQASSCLMVGRSRRCPAATSPVQLTAVLGQVVEPSQPGLPAPPIARPGLWTTVVPPSGLPIANLFF